MTLTEVIEQIMAEKRRIAEAEGNLIANAIRLGKLFAELRAVAKRRWQRELEDLGFSPRVVSRYLKLGTSWWAENATQGSDFLAQLPNDLHKLEYLCRLTREQLVQFLAIVDCRECSRSELIAMVQRLLGEKVQATSTTAKRSIDTILKDWDRSVSRILDAIDGLGDEAKAEESRMRLSEGLHKRFSEVEEILNPVEEAEPPADQDSPPSVETAMVDQQPVPTASA